MEGQVYIPRKTFTHEYPKSQSLSSDQHLRTVIILWIAKTGLRKEGVERVYLKHMNC